MWVVFNNGQDISDPLSVIEPQVTLVFTDNWIMATFEIELLAEPVQKGGTKDEEPHVKSVPIKKENDSGIEYIVRIDLVSQIEIVRYLGK